MSKADDALAAIARHEAECSERWKSSWNTSTRILDTLTALDAQVRERVRQRDSELISEAEERGRLAATVMQLEKDVRAVERRMWAAVAGILSAVLAGAVALLLTRT